MGQRERRRVRTAHALNPYLPHHPRRPLMTLSIQLQRLKHTLPPFYHLSVLQIPLPLLVCHPQRHLIHKYSPHFHRPNPSKMLWCSLSASTERANPPMLHSLSLFLCRGKLFPKCTNSLTRAPFLHLLLCSPSQLIATPAVPFRLTFLPSVKVFIFSSMTRGALFCILKSYTVRTRSTVHTRSTVRTQTFSRLPPLSPA